MERDMKDQLTDDINEIRVEFLQNWEKFMRRQNEMQADFDFLNNAMNEGREFLLDSSLTHRHLFFGLAHLRVKGVTPDFRPNFGFSPRKP